MSTSLQRVAPVFRCISLQKIVRVSQITANAIQHDDRVSDHYLADIATMDDTL